VERIHRAEPEIRSRVAEDLGEKKAPCLTRTSGRASKASARTSTPPRSRLIRTAFYATRNHPTPVCCDAGVAMLRCAVFHEEVFMRVLSAVLAFHGAAVLVGSAFAGDVKSWAEQVRFSGRPVAVNTELTELRVKMKANGRVMPSPHRVGIDRRTLVSATDCFPVQEVPHSTSASRTTGSPQPVVLPFEHVLRGIGEIGPHRRHGRRGRRVDGRVPGRGGRARSSR